MNTVVFVSPNINNRNYIYNVFYCFKLQFTSCIVLARILQKNRTNEMQRGREKENYFKKLANAIMEAGKSEICRVGHQTGRTDVAVQDRR